MSLRDFGLLFVVCLVWAFNVVITRWVVADAGVPPIFFAALRFGLIALVLIPIFFTPWPKRLGVLFIISMCMGAAHFGLLFMGLANAEASAVAVTGQLGVPFSTILSMIFLSEKIGWRRGIGIGMAFIGVMIIAVDPTGFQASFGLIYVVMSAFIGSCGAILMKRVTPIPALQMQAWVGAFSFLPLLLISFLMEGQGTGLGQQWSAFAAGGWLVWAATAFAVLAVSIFGHGMFYVLLKKYEVSLLSPLTLMTPIWGVILGVTLLNEALSLQLVLGTIVSLLGVLVIALRGNKKLPEVNVNRKLVSGT